MKINKKRAKEFSFSEVKTCLDCLHYESDGWGHDRCRLGVWELENDETETWSSHAVSVFVESRGCKRWRQETGPRAESK